MPCKSIFSVAVMAIFIVQKPSIAEPVQWTIAEGGNGHWYEAVLVSEGITWDDANAAASASGAHLATISSEPENAFVFSLFSDIPEFWVVLGEPPNDVYSGPWIGGTDEAVEGTWEWITGEPWTYENWRAGMPDDFQGQDYLQFRCQPDIAPTWDDNQSDNPDVLGYITETSATVPTVSEWGLIAMTLLLLTAGMVVFTRRRRQIAA